MCEHCNYLMRKAQGYFPRKKSVDRFSPGE
jgi:hypothetical protein